MVGHSREESMDSVFSILSCKSQEFFDIYNSDYDTAILCRDAALTDQDREKLKYASGEKYHLDKLIDAMLKEAPSEAGKRYVAVVLYIAYTKGGNTIVEIAQAWMDYLFLPMLTTLVRNTKTEPSEGQTPTLDDTAGIIGNATRSNQKTLRAAIREREGYRCAVSGTMDSIRANYLWERGREGEIPASVTSEAVLEVAHIIPVSLNDFNDRHPEYRNAAWTWESWTGLNITELVDKNINTPANAILMSPHDHISFSKFEFYFDKEAFPDVPNKYKVRMSQPNIRLSSTQTSADVQFQTVEDSGHEPPNPFYLKIHAAIARVLHHSGAAEYISRFEDDDERPVPLFMHPSNDFLVQLDHRLTVLAH